MTITFENPTAPVAPEPAQKSLDAVGTGPASPTRAGAAVAVFVAVCAVVLALTTTLMLALTNISVLAAVGFGLYCTFWLGGGFGVIAISAFLFGRDH